MARSRRPEARSQEPGARSQENPSLTSRRSGRGPRAGRDVPLASGCARPTRFRLRSGRTGRPRKLATLESVRGLHPVRSSRIRAGPRPCSSRLARRPAPPAAVVKQLLVSRESAAIVRGVKPTIMTVQPDSRDAHERMVELPAVFEGVDHPARHQPQFGYRRREPRDDAERAGGVSRERASEHARGTRTVPRAGRRGKSAHRFDERSEELARSPAARAAGPMRVARAQGEPRDATPARDSGGTAKWMPSCLVRHGSNVSRPPREEGRPFRTGPR